MFDDGDVSDESLEDTLRRVTERATAAGSSPPAATVGDLVSLQVLKELRRLRQGRGASPDSDSVQGATPRTGAFSIGARGVVSEVCSSCAAP